MTLKSLFSYGMKVTHISGSWSDVVVNVSGNYITTEKHGIYDSTALIPDPKNFTQP